MKFNLSFLVCAVAFVLGALIQSVAAQQVAVGIGHDYNNRNAPTFLLNYEQPVVSTGNHHLSLVTRNVFGDRLTDFQGFVAYRLPSAGKYWLSPQAGAACIDRYGIARCHALFGLGVQRAKAKAWLQWYAPTEGRTQRSEYRFGGQYQLAKTGKVAVSLVTEAQFTRAVTAANGRVGVDGGARLGVLFSNAQ